MDLNISLVARAGLLILILVLYNQRSADGEYISTGTCANQNCLYKYSATQSSVMGESQSTLKISTHVETACESVGTYNGVKAAKVCTVMKNTAIDSEGVDTSNLKEASEMANTMMSRPFCFVQTSEGKVVSVHYSLDEKPSIVNFKKAVAAAFQANFKYTEQEVEEDTVTKHVSQYSYENLGPDHWRMQRTVKPHNVINLASHNLVHRKSLAVQKSEVIEYKNGILLKASGTTYVDAKGPVNAQDDVIDQSTPVEAYGDQASYDASGSNELYGTGAYSLVLEKCFSRPIQLRKAREQPTLKTDENLSAALNGEDKSDEAEMKKLRSQMPSILPQLNRLYANAADANIGHKIKRLLVLESKSGALPKYVPALNEVNDYLRGLAMSTAEKDIKMRVLLYSFLAAEGSTKSQMNLVKAIKETKDQKERNTLTVQLAFVPNIHPDALFLIENIIKSSNDTTDPLILSYGALASSLSPQMQSRVIQFLHNRTDISDDVTAVHLIHAMGNTKSNLTDQHLIASLSHENPSVRLAAIYALRHRTGSPDVQYSLLRTLHSFPSKEVTDMTLRALVAGAELGHNLGSVAVNDSFFDQLLTATDDDVEQRAMLVHYVRLLGPTSLKNWFPMVASGRERRGKMWNENKKEYDIILDFETRNKDVNSYPSHKAFLWGKRIGNSKINLAAAVGAFAGVGAGTAEHPGGFKLFAKGIVRGQAFGRSKTAFEALVQSENEPGSDSIKNRMYLSIIGIVLIDIKKEIPACTPWALPLFEGPDFPLLDFNANIFIFVGFLQFHISVTVILKLDLALTVCVKECISVKGAVTPSVGLSATASATGSIINIVRGGVEGTANINYRFTIEMTGSYKLYNGPFEFCLNLRHSWPDSYVKISLYYQTRKVKICRKRGRWSWVKLPCGFDWNARKEFRPGGKELKWHLGRGGENKIWSSCNPTSLQCPSTKLIT